MPSPDDQETHGGTGEAGGADVFNNLLSAAEATSLPIRVDVEVECEVEGDDPAPQEEALQAPRETAEGKEAAAAQISNLMSAVKEHNDEIDENQKQAAAKIGNLMEAVKNYDPETAPRPAPEKEDFPLLVPRASSGAWGFFGSSPAPSSSARATPPPPRASKRERLRTGLSSVAAAFSSLRLPTPEEAAARQGPGPSGGGGTWWGGGAGSGDGSGGSGGGGGMISRLQNNPISFSLQAEIEKAANTCRALTQGGNMNPDKQIPGALISGAAGVAFITVLKGGLIFSGRVGTGLVLSRTPSGLLERGGWSAPTAIWTIGSGWGLIAGTDVTSYMIVLNTKEALHRFALGRQASHGIELGLAVGPVGRAAQSAVHASRRGAAPSYAYAISSGLYLGVSLEGAVFLPRKDVDKKFYGVDHETEDILSGVVAPPSEAQPLYDALEKAMAVGACEHALAQEANAWTKDFEDVDGDQEH